MGYWECRYPDTGRLHCQQWSDDNGFEHREDGPAIVFYRQNGSVNYAEYKIHGLLHRVDGPAIITKHNKIYYFNDVMVDVTSYIACMRQTKNKMGLLMRILRERPFASKLIFNVLTEKFKKHLKPVVINNIKAALELI